MKLDKNHGFTLIEVVIAVAIIGVILSAIFSFYFSGWDVFDFSREKIKFQRDHRLIELWISRYARKAVEINDNPAGDDEVRLLYPVDGNEDGIGFGLNSDGYFYYHKRVSGTWENKKQISDLKGKNLSFLFSDNLLTVNMTLLNKNGDKEYSFSSKYFPRYPEVATP